MKRQIYPFYCKFNDKSGKEQRVGMEVTKGNKKLFADAEDYADMKGQVPAMMQYRPSPPSKITSCRSPRRLLS